MHPEHTGVQTACSNCVRRNQLTNRWKAAQAAAAHLSIWIHEDTFRLTEQALPVNINYPVNIISGSDVRSKLRETNASRRCIFRCSSILSHTRRTLMPGGMEV